MNAFLYGLVLQWKLDIRSKALLITCYVVPLFFFAVMGGIFTFINPEAKYTLIQSMTVLGVSTGALVGLPPSIMEIYRSDIKKVYKANGVPLYLGLVSIFLSTYIHLLIMSAIIYIAAPLAFDAFLPENIPLYFGALAIFIVVSMSIGCFLGLLVKNQTKLTMVSQVLFLPSIMLSGIMMPVDFLPGIFRILGKLLPATWGYKLMINNGFNFGNLWPLFIVIAAALAACGIMLKKLQSE